jgi:cytochrome c5
MLRRLVLSILLVAPAASAEDVTLRAGEGRDLVGARCAMCHSLDYIPMNSPFLDRTGWEKTVRKMVDAMGAPVEEKEVPSILDYLEGAYGKR